MSQVFHNKAGINFVSVGTHSWAKCFIDKLRLILLLMARIREPSVSQEGCGFVTDGTLMYAKRCILIMLLMAQ